MREFTSFLEAGIYVGTVLAVEVEKQHKALDRAAAVVQREAKSLVGEYQEGAGPFAPWAELAQTTKDDRVRQGYSEDEPELRTGEMRDSIQRRVLDSSNAAVGSDDDVMVYQELGTAKMPPRSMLGIAAVHKGEEVARIIGEGVTESLVGRGVFNGSLPIDP